MTAVPSNLPPPRQESADATEPRQRAAQLLARRRRRVSRIRKGAIGASLAAFAAAWVMIFSQLVTGHDPALATNQQDQQALAPVNTSTAATAAASDTSAPASDTSAQESSGSGSSSSASGGSSSSSTLDPVTTQQS